ncbi:MAG: DUF4149 domain-containing protein [Acidobacteriaceae bacterium]
MRTLLRSLILLALAVWVGGMVFFGAVLAPVVFGSVMPMVPDPALGLHVAGTMVRISLLRLHDIGLLCGILLLVLCIVERVTGTTRRSILPQMTLLAIMLGLTAYSQYSVIPRMESLRIQAGSAMGSASFTPPRVEFDHLHHLTTALEEAVLLCGLGLIVLYARPETVS